MPLVRCTIRPRVGAGLTTWASTKRQLAGLATGVAFALPEKP